MIGVYPGSFDPLTLGHVDIVERSSKMFDKLYVAVANNIKKSSLFTASERVDMMKTALANYKNVVIEEFDGLIVDYCIEKKANVIVRGLRVISDFEYELQMALVNRRISADVESMFFMPSHKYLLLSSSIVKEVAYHGGDVSEYLPKNVNNELIAKLKDMKVNKD